MNQPVALITGAAKRIGAHIAHALHAAGYSVAVHYRQQADAAQALAEALNAQRPGSAACFAAEIGSRAAADVLIAAVHSHFGRLDALVHNASAFTPTPIGMASDADWDTLFASNARGPFFLTQAAAPALREAQGAIVHLLDIYADRPLRDHAIYVAAKAAGGALVRATAMDLAPHVRVNGVAPGAILWPESGKSADAQAALLARTPLARVGAPEDIAEAVRWLLQDARYVTGQVIAVDGGRLLAG